MLRATTVAMLVLLGVPARPASSAAADELAEDREALLNVRLQLRQTESVDVNGVSIDLSAPPDGLVVRPELGVLTSPAVRGQVIHKSGEMVWVPRATITPKGDYLVLFPCGKGQWYQGR